MSQKTPPTYTPPSPVSLSLLSGQEGQQQGYSLAQQEYAPQMNAQAQGIADIGQGSNYYNNFGPSTLAGAVGNQYMNNIIPQQQAMIQNQFANSGMQNSPALANTEANAFGNTMANVGQYEQGVSNQNATNNLGQLMSINPMNYSQPLANSIFNQSNTQNETNNQMQNQYNQALAQQQYQQQYNKYAQSNALASTIGQISPVGGQIYGALTGTSGSAFGGTAQTLGSPMNALAMNQMMNQYNMQPGSYQAGSNGIGGSTSQAATDQALSGNSSNGTNLAQSGNSTMGMFGAIGAGG